ncbi:MAG: ATPase [Bacteroidota bacterium]|nr:ATPase [Bacteroidota bacterium]
MSIKYREIFAKRDFTYTLDSNYIDVSRFYYKLCNNLAIEHWIWELDGDKAAEFLKEHYKEQVQKGLFDKVFDHKSKKYEPCHSMLILDNERVLYFYNNGCGILTQDADEAFVAEVTGLLRKFKRRAKSKKFEMNLIVMNGQSLETSSVDINKTKLDVAHNYEDDFAEVDKLITKRLNTMDDKGIVLLYGVPGTGKTTYLRYLIGKIKKKILFVPNNVAANITDPNFINLLIDNPNSVLIIEDAEQVIQDRNESGNSAVSNLLNISDGLLADCLNIQIVCTFNTTLGNIDKALLRKGRLIARYEFDKLSQQKAQRLSNHLGFNTEITCPMSVSEIYNQKEKTFEKAKKRIGFALVA